MEVRQNITTKYGELKGVINPTYHKVGSLRECMLEEESFLEFPEFPHIKMIPRYEYSDDRGKYRNSLQFYPSGNLKSIYLQERVSVDTKYGIIEGELITFYEDGQIHRIFPLYGQINGYWSEEEEGKLAVSYSFSYGTGEINNKIGCFCLYPDGALKSITLWKGERAMVSTKNGIIETQIGMSFYPDGRIKSLEPKKPTPIMTFMGKIWAYDNNPMGIHGDSNSLVWDEKGHIKNITTYLTGIKVTDKNGKVYKFKSEQFSSQLDPEVMVYIPLELTFEEKEILITTSDKTNILVPLEGNQFEAFDLFTDMATGAACGDCSSCTKCG